MAVNGFQKTVSLGCDLALLQSGEPAQTQLQDSFGLAFVQTYLGAQLSSRLIHIGRASDYRHHLFNAIQSQQKAFQNLASCQITAAAEMGAAYDHTQAVIQKVPADVPIRSCSGNAAHQHHIVDGQAGFQRGGAVELLQHRMAACSGLQVYLNA